MRKCLGTAVITIFLRAYSVNSTQNAMLASIGLFHDGVMLPPRPECFVKMPSIFKFVFFLGSKEAIGKIGLTLEATNRTLGLVVKWRLHTNSPYIRDN